MPIQAPQRLLCDSLLQAAAALPDKTALVVEGERHSYAELRDAALRCAAAMQARGLERGERVAIYMDNTWPCAIAIFGTWLAGGVLLVINPQTKTDKLAYLLHDSGAKILCTDAHLQKIFLPLLERPTPLQAVLCSGTPPTARETRLTPESFDQALCEAANQPTPSGVIGVDLAALIYTSGSTGDAKGVMMTHQAMLFTLESLVEYLRLAEGDRILNVLPFAFDYGLYQLLMAVRLGATLVLERSFTYPAQVLQRMADERVTVFPGVPTIYTMLIEMHRKNSLAFPSVTRVTNTAAALAAELLPALRAIFPNALIFKMYGLSECKRVSYLEPELLARYPNSVGKAIPGTEIFLLSSDGQPVAPGEVGLLHVRGAHVMLGYWNKPEQSAAMLKPGALPGERVLCTQDFFTMDAEGFLYFVGRSDDIIKTRGEKVSPVEVENALHGIPGIRDAAVIGIPDARLGQAIRAYVALQDDATLCEREIIKLCLAKLENFMVPKEVVILDELPKTATGKIRKKSLLEST